MILSITCLLHAENRVTVGLAEYESSIAVDTATIGTDYEFQILLENEIQVSAVQLGFKIYSSTGASWK